MRKAILLFILCLCMPVFAMTRAEIRSITRDMIMDAGTSSDKQHWSSTTLNNYIDLAVQEIVGVSWCMKNSYSFTISTGGVRDYALQNDIAQIERVTIHEPDTAANVSEKENCVALEEVSMISLDNSSSDWESFFSTYSYGNHAKPTRYFTYQSTATYLLIGFKPPADKTYTITVYYAEIPDDMTSDSDVPFREIDQLVPYHDLICLWVAARICAFDGKLDLAKYWDSRYLARLGEATKSLNWKTNYQQGISGGN